MRIGRFKSDPEEKTREVGCPSGDHAAYQFRSHSRLTFQSW
jgi:hypothetical protein